MNSTYTPTVNTRLAILFGQPLHHSLSPAMHNRAFSLLGLDWLYLPVEVKDVELATVFAGLRCMNVGGFNVTMPHKVAIMEYLDDLDPLAATIGAVNTICLRDGQAIGYNTDGYGFLEALKESTGCLTPERKRVFMIGAGGAARAICMTLADRGVEKIFLCNRTSDKAVRLAEEINKTIHPCSEVIEMGSSEQTAAIAASHILINSTSVGMSPHGDLSPIPANLLHPGLVVADIVYNPLTTRLLREAKDAGCTIVPGPGMFIHQGAAAFKLWTGQNAPVTEMAKVVYQRLMDS